MAGEIAGASVAGDPGAAWLVVNLSACSPLPRRFLYLSASFRCNGMNEHFNRRRKKSVRALSGALFRPQSRSHHLSDVSGGTVRCAAAAAAAGARTAQIHAVQARRR